MNTKSKDFVDAIEGLVWKHDIPYMDAIVLYCENKKIEIEAVISIVKNNDFLKSKLQFEGEGLNLLPKTNRLPF